MSEHNAVVGVYNAHTDAEAAVKELQKSGFDMQKLSIVGKDYQTEEHVVGYYNAGRPHEVLGHTGGLLGRVVGPAVRGGPLFYPGYWPCHRLRPAGGLARWGPGRGRGGGGGVWAGGGVGGLRALGAGLYSIGIPKDSIVEYETALKSDKFLVMAHGTADEVATATRILETTGAADIAAH